MRKIQKEKLKKGDVIMIVNKKANEILIVKVIDDVYNGNCLLILKYTKDYRYKQETCFISGDIIYKLTKQEYMVEML